MDSFVASVYANRSRDDLRREPLTLFSAEYSVAEKGLYYPVELGIVQFTFTRGVIGAYHTFISPNCFPLPSGSFANAKMHSEETHKIPVILGTFPHWNNDFDGMITRINQMLPKNNSVIFVVGAKDKIVAPPGEPSTTFSEASNCLKAIMEKSKRRLNTNMVPVADLVSFLAMKFEKANIDRNAIGRMLQRDELTFESGVRCHFHEENDTLRCAYGCAMRCYLNIMDILYQKPGMVLDVRLRRVPPQFVSQDPMASSSNRNEERGEPCGRERIKKEEVKQ